MVQKMNAVFLFSANLHISVLLGFVLCLICFSAIVDFSQGLPVMQALDTFPTCFSSLRL